MVCSQLHYQLGAEAHTSKPDRRLSEMTVSESESVTITVEDRVLRNWREEDSVR
jgi:hypothetical protein